MPHICVSESGPHWFRWCLVAYAPGHYLTQCWVMPIGLLGTLFSEILIKIKHIHLQKGIWNYRLQNVQGGWIKWRQDCVGAMGNVIRILCMSVDIPQPLAYDGQDVKQPSCSHRIAFEWLERSFSVWWEIRITGKNQLTDWPLIKMT